MWQGINSRPTLCSRPWSFGPYIGDFPAYGMLAGCTTNGFIECPVYGEGFHSRRSKVLHKNIFCNCARRFLVEEDHHMRRNVVNFGDFKPRVAPSLVSGQLALANGMDCIRWLRHYITLSKPLDAIHSICHNIIHYVLVHT